jgi:small ligand-binding sensory domain FIST
VCFVSPHHIDAFDDIVGALGKLLDPEALIGCTAVGVAGGGVEVEDGPGLSVFAATFTAAHIHGLALESVQTDDGVAIVGWPNDVPARGALLLLADPYSFPITDVLAACNERVPDLTVVGGLASAAGRAGGNRLVVDDRVLDEGAVGLLCPDDVPLHPIVSQGCRPIGKPLTVTNSDRNLLYELAGEPALTRLQELVQSSTDDERELLRRGLQLGVVVDEHKLEFGRGDFLIRNVIGAEQSSGAIAIGDQVEIGTTVQFQVRDAAAADEDLRMLLGAATGDAALLFTCNGRGTPFFGQPNHDVGVVEDLLGTVPLAGAFCAGEIGPVGGRNFLHSFTASVAVFDR